MTDATPLIEAIARDLWLSSTMAGIWDDLPDSEREPYRTDAEIVLSAIARAGYAVVPVEPTEAMMEVIREASDDCCNYWLTRTATCSYDIELMFKKAVVDAISAAQGDG